MLAVLMMERDNALVRFLEQEEIEATEMLHCFLRLLDVFTDALSQSRTLRNQRV